MNQDGTFDIRYRLHNVKEAPSILEGYTTKEFVHQTDDDSMIRTVEEDVVWKTLKQVIANIFTDDGHFRNFIYSEKNQNIQETKLRQSLFEFVSKVNRSGRLNHILSWDVNRNGQKDMIYFDTSSDPNLATVYVSVKEGEHFLPATVWLRHGKSSPEMFTFEDYNQDGKIDALYHDRWRSKKYYLSYADPASGRFTKPEVVEPSSK